MNVLYNLVINKQVNQVRNYTQEIPLQEVAEEVSKFNTFDRLLFFRMLDTETAGEIFSYFSLEIQEEIISGLPDHIMDQLLDELYIDEIADLIDEVPDNVAKRILHNIDSETRKKVNLLLRYSDDQIGSFMSVDIVYLNNDSTCKQALEKIRKYKDIAELVHYYYVVDSHKRLVGAVTLEDIVFSEPNLPISQILFVVPFLNTSDNKEVAASIFAKNDFSVLPVVNSANKLIGMVTSDDIIEIVQEEATSDMYKLAGISSKEIDDSYIKRSVLQIVKSRIFWLIILMFGSTLSQYIIQQFTDVIDNGQVFKALGLSTFISTIVSMIPVISGAAGNAGSQSATTIVRALSLNNIEGKSFFKKVLTKEISVGFLIGFTLMVFNFLRLIIYFLISGELFNNNPLSNNSLFSTRDYILIISLASSISLLLVIVFSKILGATIPLIAQRFNRDPAVMSAPVLATLTDSISTFIFFGITILVFLII
ncbi:magnesium transporter [Mesomycoplasma conjunctivae]|uniref:magnesium transporter n=1 Tax=Mesomycoplasma conjunctivae TaxID=45361 RepID=UPI003DA3314C